MERNVIYLYELVNELPKVDLLNSWDNGFFQIDESPIVCVDKSRFINPIEKLDKLDIKIGPFELEQKKVKRFLKNMKRLKIKLLNLSFSEIHDEEITEDLISYVNDNDLDGINSILGYLEANDMDIDKISFYYSGNGSIYEITKYGILNVNADKNDVPDLTKIDPIKLIIGLNSFPIQELE